MPAGWFSDILSPEDAEAKHPGFAVCKCFSSILLWEVAIFVLQLARFGRRTDVSREVEQSERGLAGVLGHGDGALISTIS